MKNKTQKVDKRANMNSSRELIPAISRIQSNIFKLRNKYNMPEDARSLLDSAGETLHAAKVTIEFEVANTRGQR